MPERADFHLVIQDANIIIDLHNAGLLEHWFSLEVPTMTSDMVEQELQAGSQWEGIKFFITSNKLQVVDFTAEEVSQIYSIQNDCSVSLPDCSVIYLAQQQSCRLLTGDRKLRRVAENYQIQCSGILWIFDLLVERCSITGECAASSLEQMLLEGCRLPKDEVAKRLAKWKAM
jgi:predicted nucleic acid-binding protein